MLMASSFLDIAIFFFEDYVQTPLTSHCQARAALKLQLWEVGTVGGRLAEHRCRGLAQNQSDRNVWNSKLEFCGSTSRKLVMFLVFLFLFIVSFG